MVGLPWGADVETVRSILARRRPCLSASLIERLAGFSAADASERLEHRLLRQTPLSGTKHQIVNGQGP